MKIKFLKKYAAAVMAVSVLSMGLVSNAAESSAAVRTDNPNTSVQKVHDDSQPGMPAPTEIVIVSYDQYLSALLDVYYRNDSRAFVALGLGTAEEATAFYNEILDTELLSMELESFLGMECPEEIENDFRALMMQLLGGARYAVTGCEQQPDGSYEVTIIYEKMIVFNPLMELYMAIVTDLSQTWFADYASMPSEEDMMVQLLAALCSSLRVCLDNVTYAEPAITTVSIELQDGTYLPNMSDIANLESLLFDTNIVFE
ncbi:MAG: hypothetical protein K2G55_10850 [Lachnospiraceae bacterium]|nr:hypothetical protein [Lachnospiraceae bacterium]MDE7201863.1 hypothetical protein [Lachnospiraceae bacterium]